MFHFRLQAALNYRKQLEERLMSEVGTMKHRLQCEKETLAMLKRRRSELISRLKGMGEGTMCAADAAIHFSYVDFIKCRERYQESLITRRGQELNEKRTELVDASKKRRIMEIMKEKKQEEYLCSERMREGKELDEMGIAQFVRR